MAKSFSVFCLYADDVRHEINGKTSFIGTYMGELNATMPAVPGNLARLVVSIFVTVPIEREFKKANIEILWDSTLLNGMNFDRDQMNLVRPSDESDNDHVINAIVVMEPLQLSGSGKIIVKVTIDDEVVMGNRLKVNVRTPTPQNA